MHVRRAQPADALPIEALYRELVPGAPNIHVASEQLAALASDPHNQLLVAELDGVICGTAFLTLCLDPMFGGRPYAVVENVVVLSSHRGRGVGRALSTALEGIARAARCSKLMLLSTATRTEAHRFFIRLGFDGDRKRGFVKYLGRG